MLLILFCTFHFSFCQDGKEWIYGWKATLKVTQLKFSGDYYWDPLSDKAEAYVIGWINGREVFDSPRACTACSPNSWHSVNGAEGSIDVGKDGDAVAKVEIWDVDADKGRDNDDRMGESDGIPIRDLVFAVLGPYGGYGCLAADKDIPLTNKGSVKICIGFEPLVTECQLRDPSLQPTGCVAPYDLSFQKPACAQPLNASGSGTHLDECIYRSDCGDDLTYEDETHGFCTLRPCENRTANSSHTYPCGEVSCIQQEDFTCALEKQESEQEGEQKAKGGGKKKFPIWAIVVIVVSVVSVAAAIILVVVVIKKRNPKDATTLYTNGTELSNTN